MFERFYYGPVAHPLPAWIAAAAALLWIAIRRPRLWALLLILEIEISLDAFATGAWAPAGAARLAVTFAILGDARFFFLVARQLPSVTRARAIAAAGAAALVVPIVSYALALVTRTSGRGLYLIYEMGFVAVSIAVLIWVNRRFSEGAIKRWLIRLTVIELVQYGLWAIADIVILSGLDIGFLIRLIPNTIYYCVFALYAVATAPAEARA